MKNKRETSKRGGKRRTSWKSGQTGNPRGAPRKGLSWRELIAAIGEEVMDEIGMTRKEAVVRAAFTHAMNGDPRFLKELMQRSEPQPNEINVHHDWREVAKAYGLNERQVLAEAERIVNESDHAAGD